MVGEMFIRSVGAETPVCRPIQEPAHISEFLFDGGILHTGSALNVTPFSRRDPETSSG